MDDDAKVCGQCGTPVEGNINTSLVKIVDPEKVRRNKRIFKFIIVVIFIVAVAVTAINVISKFTGYNNLIRKTMSAYEQYDIDTLVSLSSDIYYYGEEDYAESYFENSVGPVLDYLEASVGHSCQMSYKVNETYTMSERKEKETLENIEYMYPDFDVNIIKKIVVANITITAKQENKSAKQDLDITMSKEGGTWKLLYLE